MRQIPLKLVLIVPLVFQVVGAVGLVGYLSYRSGQNAVKNLAHQVMNQASSRIRDRLDLVLQEQYKALVFNAESIEQGTLKINDPEAIRQHLWQQTNSSSFLVHNIIANDQGEEVSYIRFYNTDIIKQAENLTGESLKIGEIALGIVALSDPNHRVYSLVDRQGRAEKTIYEMVIDPRTTPWYLAAQNTTQPSWSPIFTYRAIPSLGISIGRTIYDVEKEKKIILSNSVTLADLGTFLKELNFSPSGQAFILEPSGNLVATSTEELPFTRPPSKPPMRLSASQSQDPITQAIAVQLQREYDSLKHIERKIFLTSQSANQKLLFQVEPYRDDYGLNWVLVTVIPESDFIAEINNNTKITMLLCFLTLVITTGFGLIIAHWIARPIRQLSKASQAIAKGEWQTENQQTERIIQGQVIGEIRTLAESFYSMAGQLKMLFESLENRVKERTEALTIANQKLEALANLDSLTQIANRRRFDDYLALEWQQHQRQKFSLALILIDIDYFKKYNDHYGHQEGDECLTRVAQTLAKVPQRATDLVARYGGEEFAVILPNTNSQQALIVAESMREAIAALNIPHAKSEISNRVTISLGIGSIIPSPNNQPEDLIRRADEALYAAKTQGRDRCYCSS